MKPNSGGFISNFSEQPVCVPTKPKSGTGAPVDDSKRFRRLKLNEVVERGDFVANEQRGLEPWEGPGGFRAGAFVKPIYRRSTSRSSATKKTE